MRKKEYPAKLPIQVMVPRPMYDLITRLARKAGQTRSAMIRELLEQQVPVFEALEKSMDLIKLGKQDQARVLMERYGWSVRSGLAKVLKEVRGK